MDSLSFKTKYLNNSTVQREWHLIDAENQTLGRLASQIAMIIRGKHKPSFSPHVDCGDKVVVINADKVRLTGTKMDNQLHLRHTGYPGGQRSETPRQILARRPELLLEQAVRRMLPRTRLGRQVFHNMYVYAGTEHPHGAQAPKPLKLNL